MSETDKEFVERMAAVLKTGTRGSFEDFNRLFALARRGAEMPEGMVMVPRTPTTGMLHCGEGITDFMLPEDMPHDHAARLEEMSVAWRVMIEQWEREAALPTPPKGDSDD